ncbi:cytochrome-c peroxidase [Cupriavidus pauculus]|uniref:cytochrome-c peroxidase n=1 Tax=Cupriavidus pauculus TaxID=82633 RepID=UPI001EE2C281|nr:cytochrome-c peroxidase [Cupriavidus pauculus]GJG95151.1 c-type cytochrome [Cupriavidus pauculus]
MKPRQFLSLLLWISAATAVGAVHAAKPQAEPVQPVAPAKVTDRARVALGEKLWFDPRLSRSGFISCNSCHNLSMGGSDNLKTSIGDKWKQGGINSPTVLNSSLNFVQFWDGRAKDLQEQAHGPIANPIEMAFTHELAVDTLRSIPEYVGEFRKVFRSDKLTMNEITLAIAAFEETLVTPNARFDKWLKGDKRAIDAQELRGYQLFKTAGCVACHNGQNLGGMSFQKMGIVAPYQTRNPSEGRAAVTGKDADRFNFKVPTLRNVALTYPYFHDGEAATLTEAVDVMGRLQLGRTFSKQKNADIVAFLHTLTGDQPRIVMPILPPSNDNTPKPRPFE